MGVKVRIPRGLDSDHAPLLNHDSTSTHSETVL